MAQDHRTGPQAPSPQDGADRPGGRFAGALAGVGNALARLGIGAGIVALLAFVWFSGLADAVFPSTNGIIHIESPQIYTRERLVNDRFRERAWLESQLDVLENRKDLISAVVRSGTTLTSGDGSPPETPEAGEPPAVQAEAAFNYLRNARNTVRGALIENELDDRHDLGSNSLYQFNFGAAIIAGTRTRRVARIEMTIEPDNRLEPLDGIVAAPGARCNGLHKFECAYLVESGVFDAPTEDETRYVTEYRKWQRLFNRWLDTENMLFQREADDMERLFASTGSNAHLQRLIKPFFENLEDKASRFSEHFAIATGADISAFGDECTIAYPPEEGEDGSDSFDISKAIADFAEDCVSATNRLLRKAIDYHTATFYLVDNVPGLKRALLADPEFAGGAAGGQNLSYTRPGVRLTEYAGANYGLPSILDRDAVMAACIFLQSCQELYRLSGLNMQAQTEAFLPVSNRDKDRILNELLVYLFNRFNDQCKWDRNVIRERSDASDFHSRLSDQVETDLLDCIISAAVRDFGSHPFGSIARDKTAQDVPEFGLRGRTSSYRARQGLSSILVTDQSGQLRAKTRHEFIGVVARPEDVTDQVIHEPLPDRERFAQVCAILFSAEGGQPTVEPPAKTASLGVSGTYWLHEYQRDVNREIGWEFLERLVCDTYGKRGGAASVQSNAADGFYNVPVGLFRFINALSNSQKTFSYSVQPSGAFELERRESDTSVNLSRIVPGANGNAALGHRTTADSIEKRYKVIGFGTQEAIEPADGNEGAAEDGMTPEGLSGTPARRAEFGWYVFPLRQIEKLFGRSTVESASIKLTAVVSLPAWWDSITIRTSTEWLHPGSLEPVKEVVFLEPDDDTATAQRSLRHRKLAGSRPLGRHNEFRIELPLRLEYIRNHFLDADTSRPTLYQLHIPRNELTACQEADIVIKGERLWRSTVVTVGGQKASLIQVMPDMRGVVAHFDSIAPPIHPVRRPTVTIWTSEGQVALPGVVEIDVPGPITQRIKAGKEPCGEGDG